MVYEEQRKVILEIAEKEDCVIIGRNADFILKDRDDVLNVFIHGDMPEKVQRICTLYHVSEEDAVKMIHDTDKALFNWIFVIRLPDFITKEDFKWAVETATKKKKLDCSLAEFMTIDEGLCIRIMHLGAYKIVKKY